MAVPVKTPAPCQKGKLSQLSTLCVFIVTYNYIRSCSDCKFITAFSYQDLILTMIIELSTILMPTTEFLTLLLSS